MSIVEKAVDKLGRKPGDGNNKPDGNRGTDSPVASVGQSVAGEDRKILRVDRQALRSAGFLAPERFERQLAEEYRRIKRPLLANAFGIGVPKLDHGNLIMVASALSGEGKTHTCINLALSMAMERERTVLLVDGDVAKPSISRVFGVENAPGLLDIIEDSGSTLSDVLLHTDIPRFRLLPAGAPRDGATELLASDRMRDLAYELAHRYPDRIILIDSPPLLATSESMAIGDAVGQVALVVAAGLTSRSSVREALDHFSPEQAVNVILNKQRFTSGGGYYGGYGRYGYGERERTDAQQA